MIEGVTDIGLQAVNGRRVALIARANDKGLGYQSEELWHHLPFDRALIVGMPDKRHPDHPQRFADGRPVMYARATVDRTFIDRDAVCDFLEPCGAIFTVETMYDWTLCEWARLYGIETIVQGNPEFYAHWQTIDPQPDRWVWPTMWKGSGIIPDGEILPVGVEPRVRAGTPGSEEFVVLHPAGTRALNDRNGTEIFYDALRYVTADVRVRVTSQTPLPEHGKLPSNVELDEWTDVDDRWEMYDGVHLVVIPRRFGGLCLPALEAMASGCALAMPSVPPNDRWPIELMPASPGRQAHTPGGAIQMASVPPRVVARTIDQYANSPARVTAMQKWSRDWAAENSWDALRPLYDRLVFS